MASIIEKRLSLHKELENHKQQSENLRSEINSLQGPANIGLATCMIAHEINNLLTPIANYATLALNNIEDKTLVEKALNKTESSCRRASQIMESILNISNGKKQKRQKVKLAVLLNEVFSCLCRDFSKDGIKVHIHVPDDMVINVVPVQIQQVFMNLILNARDAMIPKGGSLTIDCKDKPECIQIKVKDTGCGINPDQLDRIFEPFYTTKDQQKNKPESGGFGFGLAFCKRIIEEHQGNICVDSQSGKGTKFIITLSKLN
ncbi:MAG: sensor histidine kinase [Planctomycetota bacterium]